MKVKLIITIILLFSSFFLRSQDLIYTVSGLIDHKPTPLDSILVENLTNKTRILFWNLPDRNDYQINLTKKTFWGTTGIFPYLEGEGLVVLRNMPGNLTIGFRGGISDKVGITVYTSDGKEIYRNDLHRTGQALSISTGIGISGIYLVKVETAARTSVFKAIGLPGTGNIHISTKSVDAWEPVNKSALILPSEDFSFVKGDSIRFSVYKKSYYAYPRNFRIENSKSLEFQLALSNATLTGISDCYVSLEGKAKTSQFDPLSGKTVLSYSGNAPGLKYGDIIVVEADTMGYLRKVTGSKEENGIAFLETRQAFLNEVFVNREIKLDTKLMKPDLLLKSTSSMEEVSMAFTDKNGYSHPVLVIFDDKYGKPVRKNMLTEKGQVSEEIPILDYLKDFSKTDIYGKKGDETHFYVDKGNISIKQNAVFDFKLQYTGKLDPETKVEEGSLKNFTFYLEGKAGFLANLALDIKRKYSKDFDSKSLFRKDIATTLYIVGGVPVWIRYSWEIMMGGKAESTDSLHAECGYSSNHTVKVGCTYNGETGEFAPLTSYDSANVIYPLKCNLDLTASLRLEINPRVNAKFYNSFGPFAEVVPFIEGNITGKTQTQETTAGNQSFLAWNSVINLGLDLRTGLKLEFLKLVDKTLGPVEVNCFKTPLWKSPLKIALKDTLPHTAPPGTKLTVTFRVTDKYGIPAPFSYIYIKGFGTFSNELIKTDLLGEATITWTLRGTEDFDVFIATVYNADKTIATDMTGSVLVRAEATSGTFTDSRDGHVYKWVTIYDQVWMAENLAYLPDINDSTKESDTQKCYYVARYGGTDTGGAKAAAYYKMYGVLYNWPAAMDGSVSSTSVPSKVRGVCPAGWHLPSNGEWYRLTDILITNQGGKMKETGYDHWKQPNKNATNSSGFTALPAGYRYPYSNGNFIAIGEQTSFWSSTRSESDTTYAYYRNLKYDQTALFYGTVTKKYGYSVRCMKDK